MADTTSSLTPNTSADTTSSTVPNNAPSTLPNTASSISSESAPKSASESTPRATPDHMPRMSKPSAGKDVTCADKADSTHQSTSSHQTLASSTDVAEGSRAGIDVAAKRKKTLIIDEASDPNLESLKPQDNPSHHLQQFTAPPWYYQGIIKVLKPLYRLSVWRRSKHNDNYDEEVAQRFGHRYPERPQGSLHGTDSMNARSHKGVIWCHAVSLGETNTVAPLLDALMAAGFGIWLTNTTQTGFARGKTRFAEQIAAGVLSHSYVPVDSDAVVDRFLAHVQPIAALFVETELWASILAKLAHQRIPAVLVNGRLSEASFKRYQKIARISSGMMDNLSLIIAQDADSAKRFRQLGAASAKIRLSGSLKWVTRSALTESLSFDQRSPDALSSGIATGFDKPGFDKPMDSDDTPSRSDNEAGDLKADAQMAALADRPIWVAASTHEGEEAIALEAHQQLLTFGALKSSLLIIVPRHPERFDAVAQLIARSGLSMARRSLGEAVNADTQVYLADSMGELMQWYQAAQAALVGGSLVDVGGHNPIEALSQAAPVIMGPYTQSCHEVVGRLRDIGALYQLPLGLSKPQLVQRLSDQLLFWLTHPQEAQRAGQLGLTEIERQQRLLPQQLNMILTLIDSQSRLAASRLL